MKSYCFLLVTILCMGEYHGYQKTGITSNLTKFIANSRENKKQSITITLPETDISEMSVYYNPKTNSSFRIMSIENSITNTVKWNDQGSTKSGILHRIGYRSNGCTCQDLICGCCLGINLEQFNFNREGCMNFTYKPNDFAINMDMFMNNVPVFTNTVSAKNPPPLCLPIVIPYLPASVEVCAKVYDVYTRGQNVHMCFDMETRVQRTNLLILHFDCMSMGNEGVAFLKPGTNLPAAASPPTDPQVNTDVFDQVTETKLKI